MENWKQGNRIYMMFFAGRVMERHTGATHILIAYAKVVRLHPIPGTQTVCISAWTDLRVLPRTVFEVLSQTALAH